MPVSTRTFEQEAGDGAAGGRLGESGEICPPCLPEDRIVRHRPEDNITNPLWLADRQSAYARLLDKRDVPFFLSRNNVTDQEWDLRCDCLLHRRTTRLSDENVVRGH